MKRKFFAIMLAFVMCFAVAGLCIGCASKTNDKTAYELWLEDGHSGTMDDFYSWLSERGEQGPAGEAGTAGVGIESAELNEEGKLVIKFTDGKSTTIAIPAGPQGAPGEPGAPGAAGNGIESIEVEGSTIVIKYTNGDTVKLPYPTKECATHKEERVELIPHTQEKPGTNLYVCNECGLSRITRTETIHEMKEIVTDPTCTEEGFTVDTCTVCGFYNDEDKHDILPALGHDWQMGDEDGYFVVEADKTICEHGGMVVKVCARCDEVSELTPIGAQGHDVAKYDIITAPTASSEGFAKGVCDDCDEIVIIALPKLSAEAYAVNVVRVENVCTGKLETTYSVWVEWYLDEGNNLVYRLLTANIDNPLTEAEDSLVEIAHLVKTAKGNHMLASTVMGTTIDADKFVKLGGKEFPDFVATCTQNGKGYYTCEACGEIAYIETTREHEYDESKVVAIEGQEPGCTTIGYGKVTCETCDKEVTVEMDPTGHPADKFSAVKEGDVLHLTCLACGLDEYLADYSIKELVPATCKAAGYVVYKFVVDGEDKETDKIVLAQLPHALYVEHVEDCDGADHSACYVRPGGVCEFADLAKNESAKEFEDFKSNCGKTGKAYYTCADCGEMAYVETKAHGEHKFNTEDPDYVAPTCTQEGHGECSVCGLGGVDGVIPALGHDYKVEMVPEPKADEVGEIKLTCGRKDKDGEPCCDFIATVTLPALTDEAYTKSIVSRPEIACAADGKDKYTITVPGYDFDYSFEVVVVRDNHTLGGKKIGATYDAEAFIALGGAEFAGEEATCKVNGKGYYTCELCKIPAFVETTGANRHDFGDEEPTIVAPDCDTNGSTTGHCVACDQDISEPIAALGHSYSDVTVTVTEDYHAVVVNVTCGRTFGEGDAQTTCGHSHTVTLASIAEDAEAEEPIYTEDLSARVEVACNRHGRNEYTTSIVVTDDIAGEEVESTIAVKVILDTAPIAHEEVGPYYWTSVKAEKIPVLVWDGTGAPVIAGYKEVEVTYDYVGFICTDCNQMIVDSWTAYINGSAVVEDEEGNFAFAAEASHELAELAILKVVIEEPVLDENGEPVLDENEEEVTKLVAYELTACLDEDCVIEGLGAGLILIDTYEVELDEEAPELE